MKKLNDKKMINDIRMLSLDMINNASSGHPGICLDAAPIMYTLFKDYLNFDLENPSWFNRDRFVMSSGHGSALLYAIMYCTFGELNINDLKNFRNIYSKTPGHPEYNINNRIECTTGPLGQGIATAVGMAMGGKYQSAFNGKKEEIFNYRVYALCGDGDLMEGVSYEASFLAGKYELDNLTVIYDANNVSLDGNQEDDFVMKISDIYTSLNWTVIEVKNGENIREISKALNASLKSSSPTLIIVNTTIGIYSKYEGTNKIHGNLEKDDLENIRNELGCGSPFSIDNSNLSLYRDYIKNRTFGNYNEWMKVHDVLVAKSNDKDRNKINSILSCGGIALKLDQVIDTDKLFIDRDMRDINYQIMNVISAFVPNFIGGSADVVQSTKTYLKGKLDYNSDCYNGRNIEFGVREHAMGSILNGLSLVNMRCFGSTYLSFSNYMIPAIRLASMMKLPVNYVFTHDSILNGQDGATHQPIEQLGCLRSIPNLDVYRPCDYRELLGCWNMILGSGNTSALVLPRGHVPVCDGSSCDKVKFGGYIVSDVKTKLDLVLVSTGSEVSIAMKLKEELLKNFIEVRVVSVPNVKLFLSQPKDYIEQVIPSSCKTMILEFSNDSIWYRFVKDSDDIINVSEYGLSAKPEDLLKEMELDIASLMIRIKNSI